MSGWIALVTALVPVAQNVIDLIRKRRARRQTGCKDGKR